MRIRSCSSTPSSSFASIRTSKARSNVSTSPAIAGWDPTPETRRSHVEECVQTKPAKMIECVCRSLRPIYNERPSITCPCRKPNSAGK
jgi:hypothetical protein